MVGGGKLWLLLVATLMAVPLGHQHAKQGPATLDLDKMTLTFSDEFDDLSVSAWGPGTRWIAHTPWFGDFGDAAFADPEPGFPFTILPGGILRIEARKGKDGNWRSGLLASVDPQGRGFSQQYGHFEMRAKLPRGPGLWPAFWLGAIPDGKAEASLEVDVLEHYGHAPHAYQMLANVWFKEPPGTNRWEKHIHEFPPGLLYEDFQTYGVTVGREWIVFYMNRVEIWRTKTPVEHKRPLMILLNLALGSGWPIDRTPNPSYMYVDYVRAYAE